MNVDGYTYIIYDKFAKNHSYNNPLTNGITLDKLLESDAETIEGVDAIKHYNSYASSTHKIKDSLDYNFYKILLFKLKENNISILVVGVSHKLLGEHINNIPNKKFLLDACSCHISYSKNITLTNSILSYDDKLENLIKISTGSNTDITDQIIENPSFTKINLFDYQRKTVKWMYDKEKNLQNISYSNNDEIFFGDYVCDTVRKDFISVKNRKNVAFYGGLLADEVGLGKTFQTIALSLLNPPSDLKYFVPELKRLQSRATLIICPNQLCNQWIREITKTIKDDYNVITIPMMTKVHYDKYSYMDILDADFVIVSFNFLGNDAYYNTWLKKTIYHSKQVKKDSQTESTILQINEVLDNLYKDLSENPLKLFSKNPVLNCINFQRVVCDEFHEIYTVNKYNYLRTIIRLFSGNYKWCVTGTPFNKNGVCAENMIEYITKYKIQDISKIVTNDTVYNYIIKQLFRRNTKKSIRTEYKLEPYDEKIILMKLSPTERAIYSAYLANPNNSRFSVLVRQLCNDPRLADEIKLNISTCKTPEDIEKMMVKHYQTTAANALEKVEIIKYSIRKLLRKITITKYKRCRKFLRQLGNKVKIEFPPKIYDPKFEKKVQELLENEEGNNVNNEEDEDEEDEDRDSENKETNKKLIIINDKTIDEITKSVQTQITKSPSITLENLEKIHETYKLKLDKFEREYQGKRGTCEFFTNMLNKLNKLKSGEELDEEDKDNCPICLNEITGDDVGVTKCGHLFCYECIKHNIVKQPKCPTCTKPATPGDIFMISYEKPKVSDNKDNKDKQDLINKIGTKLANLVLFLKSNKGKSIVFSQWDDMLHRTGEVLNAHGIRNVFCKGNVWTRDKAIREFTFQEDVKVIMLSSESAAAGTNLTAAENVILLDAIYKDDKSDNITDKDNNGIGSYEYRRNMEWQAIGRAYRMGQTKKVSVIRFIMKDTVEEEIYKINKEEDKKFKDNTDLIDKMIETTDDNINATTEEIKKMTDNATKYKQEKEKKTSMKKPIKLVKGDLPNIIDSDSDFDSSDEED